MRRGLLGAVLITVSACGMDVEQQGDSASIDSELNLGEKGVSVPERDCRFVTVRPLATGTLRAAPEQQMLEVAPVGTLVQSMMFEHVTYGSETRHGIVEFQLPALNGRVTRADLRFTDKHGYQVQAVPADTHKLILNGQVDGTIGTNDWTHEGDPFVTFTTDLNDLNPPQHRFDVRSQVKLGGALGLRINLDRTIVPSGTYGSSFEGFGIDLTICNEDDLPNGQPNGDPL